jgi:O-antigen ligase
LLHVREKWLCGAVLASAMCGALVVVSPISAAVVLIALLLPIVPELPNFGFACVLLVVRALVDRPDYGGSVPAASGVLGLPAVPAGILILLGLGVATRRRRGVISVLLMGSAALISNVYGVELYGEVVRKEFFRLASVLALIVVLFNSPGVVTVRRAAVAVQVVALVPAIVALGEWINGTGMLVSGEIRPAGTLAHPNSAAVLFSISGLASFYVWSTYKSKYNLCLLAVFVSALFATASLTGLATLAVMIIAFMVFDGMMTPRKLLSVACTILGVLAFIRTPLGGSRLAGLFQEGAINSSATRSFDWRLRAWSELWQQVGKSPLFGQGLGSTTSGLIVENNVPHNEYLRIIVELGFVGGTVVLVLVAMLTRALWRRLRLPSSRMQAALGLALLIGLMLNGITANTLLYSVPLYAATLLMCSIFAQEVASSDVARGGRTHLENLVSAQHVRRSYGAAAIAVGQC